MDIFELPFQFVANARPLDLLNTCVLFDRQIVDLIDTPERLTNWLDAVAEAPPLEDWSATETRALFDLRESFRRVLKAVKDQKEAQSKDLAILNFHLASGRSHKRLTQSRTGFAFEAPAVAATPQDFLAGLAEEFAQLIVEGDTKRIKTCAHPSCVLMFHDTSKSGRRRWCSMETCGNRTKAATFRASHP